MLKIADEWSRQGHLSDADELYQMAAALARESGSFHLRKKAHKRRVDLSELLKETDHAT